MLPRSGDVLEVGREASVQFATPMLFRVIRVHDWPTYDGWVWIDGYELNTAGDAIERRSIFVQISGLHPARQAAARRPAVNTRQQVAGQRTGDVTARRAAPPPQQRLAHNNR